jgi:hypothetical protein
MSYIPSSRETLTAEKKRMVVALYASGSSQRAAAQFIACSPTTIARTAARDPEFTAALQHAHQSAELALVQRIQNAGKSPQFWRASAWLLERMNPDDFVVHPEWVSEDQLKQIITTICEVICEDLPSDKIEKIQQKFDAMFREQGFRQAKSWKAEASVSEVSPSSPLYDIAQSASATDTHDELCERDVESIDATDSSQNTSDDVRQVG